MDREQEILERLNSISDKEWIDVIDLLTTYIHFKIKGKTLFGAHSEQNLGLNPVDYYVNESIGKLFSLEWEWKFEKYSLLEQLQRIVGSMISTNVEKFKTKKVKEFPLEDEKLVVLAETEEENSEDETYNLFRQALEECSADDEELQLYVMAFDECSTFDEMSKELGFDKKKLYSLQKKLTRRMKTYLETNKSLIK